MTDTSSPIRRQRDALCDVLESLTEAQWSAETLCAGWDAGDVAAHLLVREREPLAALGILLPPLSSLTEARMRARKARGRDRMVAQLRSGPTPWMRLGPMEGAQVAEDWIHTADIVRGGAADVDGPRLPHLDGTEDPQISRLLWKAVSRFTPITLRSVDVEGIIALTDGERTRTYQVGGAVARAAEGATPDATVTGPVGDLLLFATGRRRADVEVRGDATLREAVESCARTV